MKAYGATLILVTQEQGMEGARDLALSMAAKGEGLVLNQFANRDNPDAHYRSTGPELWRDTDGTLTHMVCTMGTTGTIMGLSRYLKEQNPDVQIIGVQPGEGAQIPGIRAWPEAYLPDFFERERVDRIVEVTQEDAENMTRRLATEEGIFAGISSGGAMHVALQLAGELEGATIGSIVCDRGDRYLSTGSAGSGELEADISAGHTQRITVLQFDGQFVEFLIVYRGFVVALQGLDMQRIVAVGLPVDGNDLNARATHGGHGLDDIDRTSSLDAGVDHDLRATGGHGAGVVLHHLTAHHRLVIGLVVAGAQSGYRHRRCRRFTQRQVELADAKSLRLSVSVSSWL